MPTWSAAFFKMCCTGTLTTMFISLSVAQARARYQLARAIRAGVAAFEQKFQTQVQTRINVNVQTPVGEPCLQVIDYMN